MIVPFAGMAKASKLSSILGKYAEQKRISASSLYLSEKSWQDIEDSISEAGDVYDSVRCILESCACLGSTILFEETFLKLDDLITRYGKICKPFDLKSMTIYELRVVLQYHGADILRNFIKTGTMTDGRFAAFDQVFMEMCKREKIDLADMPVKGTIISANEVLLFWMFSLWRRKAVTIGPQNNPWINKSLSANDSLSEVVRVCWMMNELLVQPDDETLRQEIRLHTLLSLLFWFKGVEAGRNWISILPVFTLFVVSGLFLDGALPAPSGVISDMALGSLTDNLRKMGYKGKF